MAELVGMVGDPYPAMTEHATVFLFVSQTSCDRRITTRSASHPSPVEV
jgi:hypothetical protein